MFTSGCRPWLKNVACLSSLISYQKQGDTFEFSSILSTADRSKYLIMAWIIRKSMQLVSFETSSWTLTKLWKMCCPLNKVKPVSVGLVSGWVTKYEHAVDTFFPYSKSLFQSDIKNFRTAVLALCRFFYFPIFFPHFALAVFMCTHLQ